MLLITKVEIKMKNQLEQKRSDCNARCKQQRTSEKIEKMPYHIENLLVIMSDEVIRTREIGGLAELLHYSLLSLSNQGLPVVLKHSSYLAGRPQKRVNTSIKLMLVD